MDLMVNSGGLERTLVTLSEWSEFIVGGIVFRGLLILALGALSARGLPAQRRTVFVLVDESGSLKSDRAGWRKQAASLLAYSLSDGSSMSLSGFGNAGRRLALTPALLDYTSTGLQRRDALARTAAELKDSDKQTDLFGAIHAVLVEASKMDPALRKSAPPALVVLSDFRSDPAPDPATRRGVCEELGTSHVDLVEVGFGSLDKASSDYLAACAGTTIWGRVSDPAALPEVFWKLQNRFTRSLKVFDDMSRSGDVNVPVPAWAEELLVLGLNTTTGSATADWMWSSANLINVQQGERYRLGRVPDLPAAHKSGFISLQMGGSMIGLRVIAVARGALSLSVTSQPPPPWIRSEIVSLAANLTSAQSGAAVTEWQSAAAAQYGADVKVTGGGYFPLRLNPELKAFQGVMTIPSVPSLAAEVNVSIDGAVWSDSIEGAVVPLPLEAGLDGQGRLIARTWSFGAAAKEKMRSSIPNREFDVTLSAEGAVEVYPKSLHFNASAPEALFRVRAKHQPTNQRSFTLWFEDEPPRVGSLALTTHLKSGQVIASGSVPLVIELQPLWKRAAIAIAVMLPALICLIALIRGRALPKWLLVPSDAFGNPVRGAEVVKLGAYRRSLDLKRYGMPGAVLYRSMGGRVSVRLHPGVELLPAGMAKPQEVTSASLDSKVGLGDCLRYRKPDGTNLIYRIDAF